MKNAGEKDPKLADRCDFFQHRVSEEFYDLKSDPNEMNNLMSDPARQAEISKLPSQMLDMMNATKDPQLERFKKTIGG